MNVKTFRNTILFFSLLSIVNVHAQTLSLTGTWKGQLSQDDKSYHFGMLLILTQKGNLLSGTAKYDDGDSSFAIFNIKGNVTGKTFILNDISIIEERSSFSWFWCKKSYSGIIKIVNNELFLDAIWNNDKRNMFSKKKLIINSDRNCAPGIFSVKKMDELKQGKKTDSKIQTTSIPKTETAPLIKDSVFNNRTVKTGTRMEVFTETINLNFYDNGDIDGDTISVYYNKKLIINKQLLTANPLTVTVTVEPGSENELLMFADNEGSLPPNTAILIFDNSGKRKEIGIDSNLKSSGSVYLFRKTVQ